MRRLSTRIAEHLRGESTWAAASPMLRVAFRARMKGRAYGYDACLAAWCWFRDGWNAAAPAPLFDAKCCKCGKVDKFAEPVEGLYFCGYGCS